MSPPASGPLGLTAYRLATAALAPFAPAVLSVRARRGKEDPARLGERLGRASLPRPPGPLAWLHGASVGESLSLLPLVQGLRTRRPDLTMLVTSGTVTAAELLARRLPPGVLHQYAPVDAPAAAARFAEHWRPELAVFVESELWPNLLAAVRRRGARTALVSARLSEASLRGWGRVPASARAVLGGFDLVLAQDEPAGGSLARLGARDDGRLNLKLAGAPLPIDAARVQALRAAAGGPVLLAASTHPGEDARVLAAFAPLQLRARLVIAPRHPVRGPSIAALARADGLTASLQSAGEPFGAAEVHVADALGELGTWFTLAEACFVAGSWARGVGGHNPLEPARLGCPLASGPQVENWRGVYATLQAADAVRTVAEPVALTAFWAEALDGALQGQADRARAAAAAEDGTLAAALDRLEAFLGPPPLGEGNPAQQGGGGRSAAPMVSSWNPLSPALRRDSSPKGGAP